MFLCRKHQVKTRELRHSERTERERNLESNFVVAAAAAKVKLSYRKTLALVGLRLFCLHRRTQSTPLLLTTTRVTILRIGSKEALHSWKNKHYAYGIQWLTHLHDELLFLNVFNTMKTWQNSPAWQQSHLMLFHGPSQTIPYPFWISFGINTLQHAITVCSVECLKTPAVSMLCRYYANVHLIAVGWRNGQQMAHVIDRKI